MYRYSSRSSSLDHGKFGHFLRISQNIEKLIFWEKLLKKFLGEQFSFSQGLRFFWRRMIRNMLKRAHPKYFYGKKKNDDFFT